MTNDEVARTRETYRQIAAVYAQARRHRDVVAGHAERFAALTPAGGLVLDVGCGPGADTAVLQNHNVRAVGLDYSLAMMLAGRAQLELHLDFVQADMRHLPLGRCADGLWCCAALLHLPRADVPAALQGFHRVLHPGGVLYLSMKLGEGEAWTSQSYGQHAPRFFTYWQPDALDRLLAAANFTIIDGWEDTGDAVQWLVRFARR